MVISVRILELLPKLFLEVNITLTVDSSRSKWKSVPNWKEWFGGVPADIVLKREGQMDVLMDNRKS